MEKSRSNILRNLAVVLPGYAIAVAVAVLVTIILVSLPAIFADGVRWGPFDQEMRGLTRLFLTGSLYTSTTAWPGYLATLYIAVRTHQHSLVFHCIGGLLTGILAHLIFAVVVYGGHWSDPAFRSAVFCSLLGGVVGAAAFWGWRRIILSAFADDSVRQSA